MRPIVISLDQNAASGLAMQRSDDDWQHLHDVLTAGLQSGLLVCPIPSETELETVPCRPESRRAIEETFAELSYGIRLKTYWEQLNAESLALVRSGVDLCPLSPPPQQESEGSGISQDDASYLKSTRQARLDAFEHMPEQTDLSTAEILESISLARAGDFYRNLGNMLKGAPLDPRDFMTAGICAYLVKNDITADELVAMRDAVIHHKWDAIPVLYYHSLLSAWAEHGYLRGKAATANDEVDRTRTAMALFSADYFLTDSAMAELCKKAKTAQISPTKVFTVRDRKDMTADLEATLTHRSNID